MYTAEASVFVDANPETAWQYVSNYSNFDQFMPNVKEIKMLEGDTSEWHLSGPLGIPVSWQAITTTKQAPSHLAWHSVKGSVETKGFIKIEPASSTTGAVGTGAVGLGGTLGNMNATGSRITVHMEYTPPLGALGEAFAALFKDPQKMLEDGLQTLAERLSSSPVATLNKQETRQVDAELGQTQPQNGHNSVNDPDWDVNRGSDAEGIRQDGQLDRDRTANRDGQLR